MVTQTVLWTPLPSRIAVSEDAQRQLMLSVFVSPRLDLDTPSTEPRLDAFPDFLDWPARVRSATFEVEFGSDPALRRTAERDGDEPQSLLWRAMFPPETLIRSFKFDDFSGRRLRSYPVFGVFGFLKDLYARLATDPNFGAGTELPTIRSLVAEDALRGVRPYQQATFLPVPRAEIDDRLESSRAIKADDFADSLYGFGQLELFHLPRSIPSLDPTTGTFRRLARPRFDFHEILSLLGEYPALLRRLGLVVDLVVNADALIPTTETVRVVPSWRPTLEPIVATRDWTPKTQYVLAADRFTATAGLEEHHDGMLDLSDPSRFSVVQVDIDGAALKSINFAMSLAELNRALAPDTPRQAGVPSLRSSGISVVQRDRAYAMHHEFIAARKKNQQLETGVQISLTAEDLFQGYRLDVWDETSQEWFSLHERVGTYRFGRLTDQPPLELADEGVAEIGITQAADMSSTDLFLHESLFRWDGWSLSAPRPGAVVPIQGTAAVPIDNAMDTGFGLGVRFAAKPRSLPRLRFGRSYRLRARTVDLAGNSIPLRAVKAYDFSAATEPIFYARFEPVAAPALVLRGPLGPGESVERLVIRSNYDTDSVETNERHVVPPKTSQILAETHGLLDPLADDHAKTYLVSRKEKGTLLDTVVLNVETGVEEPIADVDLVKSPAGEVLYAIHGEAQVKLPYLPDPIARGAALHGLPGAGSQLIPFDGSWPDLRPFRLKAIGIEATDIPKPPDWQDTERVLTVEIPKGVITTLRLSSYLHPTDLPLMGIWRWAVERLRRRGEAGRFSTDVTAREIAQYGLDGRYWMLTPYRDITLVHAVRQPLREPQLVGLAAGRKVGETFATLTGAVRLSARSTAKVDVQAVWSEPMDDPERAEPQDTEESQVRGSAHAFELAVDDPGLDDVLFRNLPPGETRKPNDMPAQRHELGDTKYRRIEYRAVATSRFREYFSLTEPEIAAGGLTRTSPLARLEILNSARPKAPNVLYAIPTFGWEGPSRLTNDVELNRTRVGASLRVYLDRPWYSSGAGELLGVVLSTSDAQQVPLRLKQYVTQWGSDPLWQSGLATLPEMSLPNAVMETGLTIDEAPGLNVAVAGYVVSYDRDRRLWYADITLDSADTYFPFVRLALARYQPKSVAGDGLDVKLSRVVLADFAQLAPHRWLSLSFTTDIDVTVTVHGLSYQRSGVDWGPSTMTVAVERQRFAEEGLLEEDLNWVPASEPVYLSSAPGTGSLTRWSGSLSLPAPRGTEFFRLAVREYEVFASDAEHGRVTERVVFADALVIG